MAEKTVNIKGKEATLVRDGDGPVYVTHDGKFAVWREDEWKFFGTLKGLDRAGGLIKPTVKLMRRKDKGWEVIEAVSWTNRGIVTIDGKRIEGRFMSWYPFNQKAQEIEAAIEQEVKPLHKEIEKIRGQIAKIENKSKLSYDDQIRREDFPRLQEAAKAALTKAS